MQRWARLQSGMLGRLLLASGLLLVDGLLLGATPARADMMGAGADRCPPGTAIGSFHGSIWCGPLRCSETEPCEGEGERCTSMRVCTQDAVVVRGAHLDVWSETVSNVVAICAPSERCDGTESEVPTGELVADTRACQVMDVCVRGEPGQGQDAPSSPPDEETPEPASSDEEAEEESEPGPGTSAATAPAESARPRASGCRCRVGASGPSPRWVPFAVAVGLAGRRRRRRQAARGVS